MKRKPARKHAPIKKANPGKTQTTYFSFISVGFAVFALVIAGGGYVKATSKIRVLGAETGPVLLARDGIEDPGTQQTDTQPIQQPHGDTNSAPSQSLNGGVQPTGISGNTPINHATPTPDTQVDCVGPDGRHFTTSFHDCQELNFKWGNISFQFTPLSTPATIAQPEHPELPRNDAPQSHIGQVGTLEVQTEGHKGEVNLHTPGLQVELKREDNGALKITAHKPDGSEVQLLEQSALDKINQDLQGQDIEVGTTSADRFAIKSKGVEAETDFPLSVNPTTNTLTVVTPSGIKDVTTLPDQAVEHMLAQKVFTNILSSANQTTASAAAANKTIVLTEIQNQPAFAIQGVSQKSILGLIPVAFTKTAYVSATTGNTIQIDESLFNKLLEAISF